MSGFSQKHLLSEALSWLDSLPAPSSSHQTTKPTAASSKALTLIKPDISRELSFSVRPFYLADDYEDMLPSWTDTLYSNQSLLKFGFKRWNKYSMKRASKVAYDSQIIARLPTWRAFVYSARAIAQWRMYALQHKGRRRKIDSKLKPLQKLFKITRMIRFWRIWSRSHMRLRRLFFLSWNFFIRRLKKLRKIMLRAKCKDCFYAWKRRARWPKVASQWQSYHSRLSLDHWHAVATHPARSRRQQAISLRKAKACLLHSYIRSWTYHMQLNRSFQLQHQLLRTKGRQEMVSVWKTWTSWTCVRIEQYSKLKDMQLYFFHKVGKSLLRALGDKQYSHRSYEYAGSKHRLRMMKTGLMAWYKSTHKHNIHNERQQVYYKDSLLHYAHKYFRQYRQWVSYMRKQRLSSVAYVRSTRRIFLSLWRDNASSSRTPQQLMRRAVDHHKRRSLRALRFRVRVLKALRKKRRRQFELACKHTYLRRYFRRIQQVLKQKYSLERARQRFEVSRVWLSWQRWRTRAARHEQLRRLYNIYGFKQLAKGRYNASGTYNTLWSRGSSSISLFAHVDKDQAEIQRRTLLVQVFYAWKLRFLPMQKKERNLQERVMFKHRAYLTRRLLLGWHAAYEDVAARRGVLHHAVCRWWNLLVTTRYQRKILAKHGIVYSDRIKVHRLLRRWRSRVLSHYQCMRSASMQKHYVLKEFNTIQRAVQRIEASRNFHVSKIFLRLWYVAYLERQNRLRPIVTRIALRHVWQEWVTRYNDAVVHASLSLSYSQQPRRRLIDVKSSPVCTKENKENNKFQQQRSVLLKRQVDFSYTIIHPTSIHDALFAESDVSSSHVIVPRPRTVDKEPLVRGYVKRFEKRKQNERKEASLIGVSFVL